MEILTLHTVINMHIMLPALEILMLYYYPEYNDAPNRDITAVYTYPRYNDIRNGELNAV
jgi:hypothetical protein